MIVYSLLAATLLSALLSILLLWPRREPVQAWQSICHAIAGGTFTYLYGTWFFLSLYARYAYATLLAILFIRYMLRRRMYTVNVLSPLTAFMHLLPAFFLMALSVLYYTGTNGVPFGTVDLAFPFKKGTYLIMQGGNGLPSNLFHYNLRKAVHAIDIAKLNNSGNRARAIFSKNLNDYEIYNDTVYAPCDGVITATESSNPDNKPGIIKRGPKNTNYVVIEAPRFYVFLAHFRPGSLLVADGQQVKRGQPIAQVGNSGFSLEPHLHMQVHARRRAGFPWYHEQQLQIRFHGKVYYLFETVYAERN